MLNFGGFLSSNFWSSYRCQSSASIEDLLNNKECTVDKLLDDDDCLQEFKNHNDKLIRYFDHEKLKTLIDYITVMPDKDDGHNRGRKYPFITGEIFNCEINQILDKFFEAPVKPVKDGGETEEDNEEERDSEEDKKAEDDDSKETPSSDAAKNLEDGVVIGSDLKEDTNPQDSKTASPEKKPEEAED